MEALQQAGNGNSAGALALFSAANFPEERQERAVRQAFIEVSLSRLLDIAASGQCPETARRLVSLGNEDRGLPLTFASFDAFMKGARFQYLLGLAELQCVDERASTRRWERVAKMRPEANSLDYAYPLAAMAALGRHGDEAGAYAKVQHALESAAPEARPVLLHSAGVLLVLQGKLREAEESFRQAAESAPPGVDRFASRDILRRQLPR